MNTELITPVAELPAALEGSAPVDAARLAEAFALFSRASEELSTAYGGLQAQVGRLSERLAVLMEALPAAVVVVDRSGTVVEVNRAAQGLFGAALVGSQWRELAGRLQATTTPGEFSLGAGEGSGAGEAREARRLSLSEATLESGDGRIILVHDITETHRMRLAAERNERLAAMGEMVAGLAHQLRTPLAAALLYTGSLRQGGLDGLQRQQVADRALERLRYLERLIRDMLLFARGDSIGRQHFEACALAGELAHALEPLARARQLRFTVDCGCPKAVLAGDRKALTGALTNLLENAIQASGPGKEVALEVREVDAAHNELGVAAVSFAVRDQGAGIDPAMQERLFEPFFTTRAEGTGLGLAIARGVARAHGGEISLSSVAGQGTTFTLVLPLPARAQAEGSPQEPIRS